MFIFLEKGSIAFFGHKEVLGKKLRITDLRQQVRREKLWDRMIFFLLHLILSTVYCLSINNIVDTWIVKVPHVMGAESLH